MRAAPTIIASMSSVTMALGRVTPHRIAATTVNHAKGYRTASTTSNGFFRTDDVGV